MDPRRFQNCRSLIVRAAGVILSSFLQTALNARILWEMGLWPSYDLNIKIHGSNILAMTHEINCPCSWNYNVVCLFIEYSLANKQDKKGAMDELDICENLRLEDQVNMHKIPCKVVCQYANNKS